MAKIQLKRSVILDGTSAKEPTSSQMNYGEIAINYNKDDPSIFIKDSDDAIIRIAGVNAKGNTPSDIQGYPDILDGEGATLDNRYLKLGSGIGAQVVQSSSATDFNGGLKVSGGSTYLLELADSGATKFVVLPTGQVGIGVTTPTAPLQVNGQVVAGSFAGTGTAITTLDAGNISQGTINTARLPATYTLAQQIAIQATGSLGHLVLNADKNIGLTASGTGSYITLTGNNGVGSYRFTKAGQTTIKGFLDFESITADRTFTYPNVSGTLALTTSTVDNSDKLDGQHGVYYTNYTDTAITNVVDGAPSTLNTLNKLAASLNDDANFSTTVTNILATKLPLAGGTMTGNINMNGSQLVAAGKVGIGTDDPQYPLQVVGDIRLGANNGGSDKRKWLFEVTDDGSNSKLGIQSFAGGSWNDKLSIVSNGNVGIGTTNASTALHISGTGVNDSRLTVTRSGSSGVVGVLGNNLLLSGLGSDGTDGGTLFYTGGIEAARILSNGNFGIGTSSPTAKLDVNGDATINSLTIGLGGGNISSNTAAGYQALYYNTTGANNTANGYKALFSNTTGANNTANGRNALTNNITGSSNTATGQGALFYNTTGSSNTANGYRALYSNTTGSYNVATGREALYSNTTGSYNVATGREALFSNTTGSYNTANGFKTLFFNTTGSNNTANGRTALYNNTTGSGNIGIGFRNNAGTYAPVFNPTTEDNRLVLGHTAITNAYVQVAWTVTSDERDKMNFAPVPYGLDFVNQLKPTAYQFKVDRDTETPNGDVRYGFKAQDILALEGDNPVIIDTEDADHLKYKGEHLVPVLVNAVQELTAMVNELKSELAALKGA